MGLRGVGARPCGDELAPHPKLADSYRSSDEQQEQERRRQTRSQWQERYHVHIGNLQASRAANVTLTRFRHHTTRSRLCSSYCGSGGLSPFHAWCPR